MRILHLTQGYAPAIGGTEWLIQRVSEELVRQFHDDVTVFTTDCYNGEAFARPWLPRMASGWEERNGVRIRRFRVWSRVSRAFSGPQRVAYRLGMPFNQYARAWYSGPVIPGLTRAVRSHQADVVAASSFPLRHMFQALRGAHRSGRPCVLHGGLHPHDLWGFDRPMIYRAIRDADFYIANTRFEADYVTSRGATPARVAVIGVGVDSEPFTVVGIQEAKRRFGLDGHLVVGFIGQIGGHKGVDTLLSAMVRVWESHPEVRLLIAGARTIFLSQLESALDGHLAAHREKIKWVLDFNESEKPFLFAAVDVFAYPSGYESFGVAYLEAWAAGKPVIGCAQGAVPDVIDAGRDGLLVPYLDVTALAGAIQVLLGSPGYAQALGARGREKALSRYTWPAIAKRFRDVYERASVARARG